MPHRTLAFALMLVAWLVEASVGAAALEIEFSGRPVRREILALYDGRVEKQPHLTRIHRYAEMPLNHLGYRLTYVDVNGPLPNVGDIQRLRGILTWFLEPLQSPAAAVDWLDKATQVGTRHVVMGEIAPPAPERLLPRINRILGRIGLEHTGEYIGLTYKSRVVEVNAAMVSFERPVDKVLPGFPVLAARGAETEAHLIIQTPAQGGPLTGIVVATGPGGGFAVHDYALSFDPNTDRVRWVVNPFAFFRRAFGDERMPVPDITTLSGRRIYFSHIDGDGWNNGSEIEGYRQAQAISADVIAREAILAFPDLPVSVGLVAGDVDVRLGGNEAGKRIGRQLYALPQVEVASHTYTHPFKWQFFETFDRAAELAMIAKASRPDRNLRDRVTAGFMRLARKDQPSRDNDPYFAGSDEMPRAYMHQPFDLEQEIAGALKAASDLAPPGKPAQLYLWSGDTTPFPAAIAATRRAGARNINGGDSRLDREYPSVAYVPPIGRSAGAERQIYAVNSNENTYTNDWAGPYYGFFLLEQTLVNTESPRRLKGFNLYYHMYSGEKPAALAAVRYFLDMARKGPLAPIAASHYAAMADDFYGVEIQQLDASSWAVANRGAVQTVRFDTSEGLAVDMAASQGVIGYTVHAGSLYVALDSAVVRARVTLMRADAPVTGAVGHPMLSLKQGRWLLSSASPAACALEVTAQGFGPGDMQWRTTRRGAFRVVAARHGNVLSEEIRWPEADGTLTLRIDQSAIEPLRLRLECHD